jgi:hypothetical protein
MHSARLTIPLLLLTAVLIGCDGAPKGATNTDAQTNRAAPGPVIEPGPADQDMIDVCGLLPRRALEDALGELTGTKSNNRRGMAGIQTDPGYGSCYFEGPGFTGVRVDVSTAFGSSRAGLGSPLNYVEKVWPIGQGAVETVGGLGLAARLSDAGSGDVVIVAASDDRYVQVIANGIPRAKALELARAALVMPLAK